MDNTEKLLRALIDGLGYEIEEKVISQDSIDALVSLKPLGAVMFTREIDYKVTKKESSNDFDEETQSLLESGRILRGYMKKPTEQDKSMRELISHSEAWSAICGYVLFHKEDVEIGINDFGDLKPVLEFFNRNSAPSEDINHDFGDVDLEW